MVATDTVSQKWAEVIYLACPWFGSKRDWTDHEQSSELGRPGGTGKQRQPGFFCAHACRLKRPERKGTDIFRFESFESMLCWWQYKITAIIPSILSVSANTERVLHWNSNEITEKFFWGGQGSVAWKTTKKHLRILNIWGWRCTTGLP